MIEMDEINKYNFRNAVHLLKKGSKINSVGVYSRTEYRFLLRENLIYRSNISNRSNYGRRYYVTDLGVREMMKNEL